MSKHSGAILYKLAMTKFAYSYMDSTERITSHLRTQV